MNERQMPTEGRWTAELWEQSRQLAVSLGQIPTDIRSKKSEEGSKQVETEPTITVSLTRKINLGNYESADAFVSLSGLPIDATSEQIDALLATGELAWSRMEINLQDEIERYRASVKAVR